MESGAIADGQISASSYNHAVNTPASRGRLHLQTVGDKVGAWEAGVVDENQWLQVYVGNQDTRITAVATQGRNWHYHMVTRYKLQYSDDGVIFQYYREQGQVTDKVKWILLTYTLITMIFTGFWSHEYHMK